MANGTLNGRCKRTALSVTGAGLFSGGIPAPLPIGVVNSFKSGFLIAFVQLLHVNNAIRQPGDAARFSAEPW